MIAPITRDGYRAPPDAQGDDRRIRQMTKASGITDLEDSLAMLPEGAWPSRWHWHWHWHWHEGEDEFLVVTSGCATLADDTGETPLVAGDCVVFPGGGSNGHP